MPAYSVQIIVFSFSGIILITGIFMVIKGDKSKAAIITVFTTGFLLIIVAAVNPYNIIELKYGRFHLKRHQPDKEYIDKSISLALKPLDDKVSSEEEKLINEAKFRPDEERSSVDYLNLATKAWREKKYYDTLKYTYTGLSRNNIDAVVNAAFNNMLGVAYSELKTPDLAITHFKNAIDLDPELVMPHNNLGSLYAKQKRYDEAESELETAIELNPEFAMPHNNLGNFYIEQKRYKEAESELETAIELDPKLAFPHINLGRLYYEQKKYIEAESEFETAIKLDPESASPHINLGRLYTKQKRYDEAESECKKAIELNTKDESARNYLKIIQALIEADSE